MSELVLCSHSIVVSCQTCACLPAKKHSGE